MLLLILIINLLVLNFAYYSYRNALEAYKHLHVVEEELGKVRTQLVNHMWGENAVLRQKNNDLVWSMEEKDEG